MAEPQTVDQKGAAGDGITIPDGQQAHEEWVPTEAENKALAGGWNPDKDAMDDPDAWVNAREFNFRGELMQRITKQGRTIGNIEGQLTEARNMIAASDRVTQRLIKQAVDQTRRDLKKQRREAMQDDDLERVDALDEELDGLKTAEGDIKDTQDNVPAVAPQRQPSPVEAAWFTFVTTTEWAQEPGLNAKLLQHAESLRQGNPDINVGDFMEGVLDKGKELRGLKKPATPPAGPDGNSGRGSKRSSKGAKTFSAADLSDQQKFIGQGYVDDGTLESLDDYAKSLGEIGGLDKQR